MAHAKGLTTRLDYGTLGRTPRPSLPVTDHCSGHDNAGNRTYVQRARQPTQPAGVYHSTTPFTN